MNVTTSFKLPQDIKRAIEIQSSQDKKSHSELIKEALEHFLENVPSKIDKEMLQKHAKDSRYTTAILPEDLKNKARKKAMDIGISFGDIVRYSLNLYLKIY